MRGDNPPCVRFVKLLDVRFASSTTFLYLCSDETKMDSETRIHELPWDFASFPGTAI